MFMQVIIEWFDKNGRTLYRRTSENWLHGLDRGEICIMPLIPKIELLNNGGSELTSHAVKLLTTHFTNKIAGFRVKILPDDEKLSVMDL